MKANVKATLQKLEHQAHIIKGAMHDQSIIEERELCEEKFSEFFKRAWPYAGIPDDLQWGWHLDALCDHLEACYFGEIEYLIVNVPPGSGKSNAVSVMFPAWVWAIDPTRRFLYASYAQSLAVRDNLNTNFLINSSWYQKLWGHKYNLSLQNKLKTQTSVGGFRIASSVGGSNTGEGGHFIIADDPNNVQNVDSDVIREGVNTWWDRVMTSRQRNMLRKCRIVIQQRAHEGDLTGHILSQKHPDVVHLYLPMEYEEKRACVTVHLTPESEDPWEDPRQEDGELLAPRLFPAQQVEKFKRQLGDYAYAGQYQQNPSPAEGGIFKRDWFQIWEEPSLPPCEFILQSWDTALSTEANASYSACTTWGVFRDAITDIPQLILLDTWHGRKEWTDLRKIMINLCHNYHDTIPEDPLGFDDPPDVVLIEAKANGLSLIQDLNRHGVPTEVIPYNPPKASKTAKVDLQGAKGKISRARLITPLVENGRIWLPARPPSFTRLYRFADHFRECCANFPVDKEETRDMVDTMSQAVEWLQRRQFIYKIDDERPLDESYKEYETANTPYYCG